MIHPQHFVVHVIEPALRLMGWSTASAIRLLLGTAMVESTLSYLVQLNGGPALGVYQMEKNTFLSHMIYLIRRKDIYDKILATCLYTTMPTADFMVHDLRFATIMARLHYWIRPEPLPAPNNVIGLTQYYLRYYNTNLGKSTFDKSVIHFAEAIRICNEVFPSGPTPPKLVAAA